MTAAIAAAVLIAGCSDEVPAPDSAADTAPGSLPPAPGSSDMVTLQSEFAGIQQRLKDLEQRALADSTLQAQFTELNSQVDQAMVKLDPEFPANRDRLESLAEQMRAAEAAADTSIVRSLIQEGTGLQTKIQSLRAQVMQDEAIAVRVTGLQQAVRDKMIELDPETSTLIERGNAIIAQMQAPPAG